MSRLVSTVFRFFPESTLKNKIRCILYNRMQKDFKLFYKDGIFVVHKENIEMKFVDNPFHILQTDKDYFLQSRLNAGDVVVDAGTYVGVFTIYASKLIGATGRVFAFEPDPGTLEKLKINLRLNNVTNVVVIDKGLWSQNTTLFFRKGLELGSSFVIDQNVNRDEVVEVPVTTIDTVLKDEPVHGRLFIKMNIEGSEVEALKGAVNTTTKYKPFVVVRTNHIVNGKTTDKPVEDFLKQYGYKTVTLQLSELTTFCEVG
jgi:FkbM family methyltransferase